jgi:hypothetical protein
MQSVSKAVPSQTPAHAALAEDDIHLELQAAPDILLQRLSDGLVKVAQNLHRQLWVNAGLADEIIERIGQSEPDAAVISQGVSAVGQSDVSVPAPAIELVERLCTASHDFCDKADRS